MLPFDMIRFSSGQEVEVWLKSGSFVKGTLSTVDRFMNLNMKNVVITNKAGKEETSKDVFIKGIELSTLNIPDLAMTKALDLEAKYAEDHEKYMSLKASKLNNNHGTRKNFNGPRRSGPPGDGKQPFRRNFGGRQNEPSRGNNGEEQVVVTTTEVADNAEDWE